MRKRRCNEKQRHGSPVLNTYQSTTHGRVLFSVLLYTRLQEPRTEYPLEHVRRPPSLARAGEGNEPRFPIFVTTLLLYTRHRKYSVGSLTTPVAASRKEERKEVKPKRNPPASNQWGYRTLRRQTMTADSCYEAVLEDEEEEREDGRNYSVMVGISPGFFLEKKRLSVVKLLRLDKRFLLELSEKLLMAVGGRLGVSGGLLKRVVWLKAGDCAPWRPDIEPLGVAMVFLAGNKPNCAVRDDMDDSDRGIGAVGDRGEAPDTEE